MWCQCEGSPGWTQACVWGQVYSAAAPAACGWSWRLQETWQVLHLCKPLEPVENKWFISPQRLIVIIFTDLLRQWRKTKHKTGERKKQNTAWLFTTLSSTVSDTAAQNVLASATKYEGISHASCKCEFTLFIFVLIFVHFIYKIHKYYIYFIFYIIYIYIPVVHYSPC